jgi:polar amino acid transport system substrate-binding protein
MTQFKTAGARLSVVFGALAAAIILNNSAVRADDLPSMQNLKKDDAIYAAIPDKFKTAGVINAATEADYPPFEFLDAQNQLIGADIDIATALSKILGVTVKNNQTEFSAIMPGLQAGRFDIGISSMGDYTSREETMDFVDYYKGGESFILRVGTSAPKSVDGVCGTAVGVLKGTSSEKLVKSNSDKCVSAGKPAIQVNSYPKQNDAVLALTSGRIMSVQGDAATNGYSAKQVGPTLHNAVIDFYGSYWIAGIAVPKNSGLFQPIYDAMGVLVKSGVYMDILKKWGLEDGALPAPGKNQGTQG